MSLMIDSAKVEKRSQQPAVSSQQSDMKLTEE
jgi:hypothetical protein